jgi:predicted DNA-binding transcriptional regulator AlpA
MPADTISAATEPHAPAALLDRLIEAIDRPELLDLGAVLRLTRQSRSSVYRAVSVGTFPDAVSTPSGKRWRRKDLLKWIEKLR